MGQITSLLLFLLIPDPGGVKIGQVIKNRTWKKHFTNTGWGRMVNDFIYQTWTLWNFACKILLSSHRLAIGQNARFAREAVTRKNTHPTPSGAVGHNPKISLGQFLGRTSLEMCFLRVVATIKSGPRTRVDAYVCLALHAGRV